MIDRLKALFGGGPAAAAGGSVTPGTDDLHLAAAALLVEAATMDGHFDSEERDAIRSALEDGFGLTADVADELIVDGERAAERSTQLVGFTRVIKDRLELEDRVKLIEMLWEVAYADGEVHHYESNLVRRIAGLLYVPDRDSGEARKRVANRLGGAGAVK